MDRRQQKTRDAIFSAFSVLLSKKNYNRISVQEIIDEANIGRTTFYAHFETKDFLLKELCEELFNHITDTAMGLPANHNNYICKCATDSVFLHLLKHLQENDLNILELLSCENNEIFLRYFKSNLKRLIISQYAENGELRNSSLPEDYLINHISSSFVETVSWWISHNMKEPPEKITEYFLQAIEPVLNGKGNNENSAFRPF
ncbi:MAG: TetR/AcrR family transcriptional regulator [Clostridia bacterium]|nr:TetR/AcrR family transcriptional regulator [Clostridia bacterium]